MPKKKNESIEDAGELTRMTVALLVCLARGLKDSADQIQIMDSFGVSSPAIAKALGISPISVRTALHRRRQASGRRARVRR
jgi:DNA-directed RNA polymerase specialized sigma24 family protein